MSHQSGSNNERYITSDNLAQKTQIWLDQIRWNERNKEKFIFKPRDSILLVVDMQRFFLDPESHAYLPASDAILPNVEKLIKTYRNARIPVIFTRHALLENEDPGIMARWWKDVIRNEDSQSEIILRLLPFEDEIVIRKTKYSAFIGTELEDILIIKMAKNVVICGVMTHLCCETTAREAFMKGFEVYFTMDATATQSEDLHLSTLRTLSNGFAIPVTTDGIISEIQELDK
jgi:isochorismate hydrolase